MQNVKKEIQKLAQEYSSTLGKKIKERELEMNSDDTTHYLIYNVLGVSDDEGRKVDLYQNKGRFLYKYAGSFLEEATIVCLKYKFPSGAKKRIERIIGDSSKTYEIDFLNGTDALEIKWRDATTDGDHITKEHARMKAIVKKGFKPIRVMFYYPQREAAIRIQETLKTLYAGVKGEYYAGDEAWDFIHKYTGVNLKSILEEIANGK